MAFLLLPLRLLYVAYAFLIFFILMLLVFLWTLMVLPFGRIRGGNLVYYGCVAWSKVWLSLVFIRHRNIHIRPREDDQAYIYVANHISYLDAALIPSVFTHPVRALGKVEMTKVPFFGFIYKNAIVTVDRSSPQNRARSVELLKSILRKGISILVFPEGTFNLTHKPLKHFYDGAFRVAIETGTPVKPVLILDAYDRMHYRSIFTLNPGRSRAVFLPAIPVDSYTIHDIAQLKQKVHDIMEKELIKYRVSWIG
ncbi:MAG TPA: lysophospholipid acyltransferase family protein [Flavisolibacter sp.]